MPVGISNMTTYTNLTKPTGTGYTNQNSIGKQQYNQSDIEYDDATIFYDGVNPNLYSNITKPSGTSYTNIAKP